MSISPYALGATLYMPATRTDLADIVAGRKLSNLSSLVVCLEDAVGDNDVESGLANLRGLLDLLEQEERDRAQRPLVFVRPRNIDMARLMVEWRGIERVDGFVAPKVRPSNIADWLTALAESELMIMPTLETPEFFDPVAVAEFRSAMCETASEKVLALRIGGNDLMSAIGLRRNQYETLYEGPLGHTIAMLVGMLVPYGFSLTAPVNEIIEPSAVFLRELSRDVAHGLVGKTAIHPKQIDTIHHAFRVTAGDVESARAILSEKAPAVFQQNGAMAEPATHCNWARSILERARHYGVAGYQHFPVDRLEPPLPQVAETAAIN